jgi:hypothetical protein
MTFALVGASYNSLWAVTDRQLSIGNRPPRDPSGVKIACVETRDGIALIAYSGVGSGKRQVSDWIGRLLHGFGGTLEEALLHIAAVAQDKLTPYARHLRTRHRFVAAAIRGGTHYLYAIDPLRTPLMVERQPARSPEEILLALAGSGEDLALNSKASIERLIRKYDCGEVSGNNMARKLARLNRDVSAKYAPWVSPECVVYWRTMNPPRHDIRAFDARGDPCNAPMIPLLVTGIPLREVGEAMRGFTGGGFDVGGPGPNCAASRKMSEVLSRGPDKEL